MEKSRADTLIDQIDALQRDFQLQFDQQGEIKWLQGVERCVELKMKVWGFDGKQPPAEPAPPAAPPMVIDLKRLSTATLAELTHLYDEPPKNQ